MTDLELALKYSPHILFDKAEPFDVKGMGFHIFRESAESDSFSRTVEVGGNGAVLVIEYAVYFNYDIQHLYDLEHVWIYVDRDGKVCDAEASFHGFYLKSMIYEKNEMVGDTHLPIYCQPGKHAFMPEGSLFRLIPDWYQACNSTAGEGGLLVPAMFADSLSTTPALQDQVHRYIKKEFSFEPTLQFEYRPLEDGLFLPWEELKRQIPERVGRELEQIAGDGAAD